MNGAIPVWLAILIGVVPLFMFLLNYFAFRQKLDERAFQLYKDTMAARVVGLEEDLARVQADLDDMAGERDACKRDLARLEDRLSVLQMENLDLWRRMPQEPPSRPRRSRPGESD